MDLYTFYICKADGSPICFEAQERVDDVAASRKALALMDEHASCAHVEIWTSDRYVRRRHRAPLASIR